MVRVVGRAPSDYDCATCPADVRGARRCGKTPPDADPWSELHLAEARRRGTMPPPDPTHPDACTLARAESMPRVLEALDWAHLWREHGMGPGGAGLWPQPVAFLDAVAVLDHVAEAMHQEEQERADADRRARQAGARI